MRSHCEIQAAGTIELLFYDELPDAHRRDVEAHLSRCAECRRALDDLSVIRTALATGPQVSSPPGGDWSAFMVRLDARLEAEAESTHMQSAQRRGLSGLPTRWGIALAMAATLVLLTLATLAPVRERQRTTADPEPAARSAFPGSIRSAEGTRPDAAFASLSGQHFARSQLIVLGLATRDAAVGGDEDWAYEWDLAPSLLSDTRLYRIAAEERGMVSLAGVMRDLELVLLEAAMAEQPDRPALEQVQRLIRRRDLVTKMNAVYTAD